MVATEELRKGPLFPNPDIPGGAGFIGTRLADLVASSSILVRIGDIKRAGVFRIFDRFGIQRILEVSGAGREDGPGLLRHANVATTLGLYAHQVNASMMAAQESVMRAIQSGTQTVQ